MYNEILSALAAAERVFRLLDEEEETPDGREAKVLKEVKGEVLFENVTFGYEENETVINDFSLTVKPISIRASNISKTMAKKLSRVSILNKETQSYTTAAYLIAQLGKNYSLPMSKQISGNILLGFALETISSIKYSVGGVIEFLECEDNEFLLSFYTKNHFKPFDTRITTSKNTEPHTLHQLLKFI